MELGMVYRRLNVAEMDTFMEKGLIAKDPCGTRTVLDHVSDGSYNPSQYISTCKTMYAMNDFISKSRRPEPVVVVEIDIKKLQVSVPSIKIIDLTDPTVLELYIKSWNERAQNFARKFQEVLIVGSIPPHCIRKLLDNRIAAPTIPIVGTQACLL